MGDVISFGIDLGTTNSLMAYSTGSGVEVLKNPVGHKETLPSCVAYRNGRVIVGEKARELIGKDPSNVFHSFKRKMGTDQRYFVESTGDFVSPIQLSALVLKELKNFNYTGVVPTAAVITIPASFDTLQSNATKEAGYQAGIEEVLLLQEPIAASLAFANKVADHEKLEGKWLVYDLGGGTFDVALVHIGEEMRILDHKGDNYLGGLDFDNLIIEKMVVPYLELKYNISNLYNAMRQTGSDYNRLYYVLQHKAEEAKKELSVNSTAELEFDFTTPTGDIASEYLNLKREDFEKAIAPKIELTVQLLTGLLADNKTPHTDVKQVVFVGGSTYIPLVKQMVEQATGIAVNNTIDPTTAIAVGAGYYASSKLKSQPAATNLPTETETGTTAAAFTLTCSYNRHTNDTDEVLVARVEGPVEGNFYRITRNDGGFDTGLVPLKEKITAILSLLQKSVNHFKLEIFDGQNNRLYTYPTPIEINQGTYSVYGQTLPNDICLEVDHISSQSTRLEPVFFKNNLLPLKKTITKTLSRTITAGSTDTITINLYEGSHLSKPSSCILLGFLEISGSMITRDIYRGSDVELVFEVTESRDIKVLALCISTGEEFSNVFKPTERVINRDRLKTEVDDLASLCNFELEATARSENYNKAAIYQRYAEELTGMQVELENLPGKDANDTIYQIEERKRYYSQLFDTQYMEESSQEFKEQFLEHKQYCVDLVEQRGSLRQKQQLGKILAEEEKLLAANSMHALQSVITDMSRIMREIRYNDPDYIAGQFMNVRSFTDDCFTNPSLAQGHFKRGEKAFAEKNFVELRIITNQLISLLKPEYLVRDDYSNTGLK